MMSIHLLADNGDAGGVAQCIAARADVNEADTSGQKPLHYAASKGYPEVVALLLQHEADPNSKNERGVTPLHEAARTGKIEAVVLLLENKADPNNVDNEQRNALHFALSCRDPAITIAQQVKVVARLLEHGADINKAAKDGSTPLHLAASRGAIPLLIQLIEKGARLDARDSRGNTALASIPLADRPSSDRASPTKRLANEVKSMLTNANSKATTYDYDDNNENKKLFSDVTFMVDGHQVHAHRNIVALRCPRLGKLFKSQAPRDDVEIRDVSHPVFQAVLEWIYSEDSVSLRSSDPDVSFVLSLLLAADRYGIKDLKAQCEVVATSHINVTNVSSAWGELRKCAPISPTLHANVAHLIAKSWNLLSKMGQDMSVADIVEIINTLTIGEVKEEQEPSPAIKAASRHHSPKRRPQPSNPLPPPAVETPVRTQPERNAHRQHTAPPPTPPPEPVATHSLPPDISTVNIGNNNYLADKTARMEGKNLRNAKVLHSMLVKNKAAWPFLEPVDPVLLGIPNYLTVIKRPMDLRTIKGKLDHEEYTYVNEFAADVRLVFINALTFNSPGYEIYKMSETLLKTFNSKFKDTNWEHGGSNGDSYQESSSPLAHTPTSTPNSANSQNKQQRRKGSLNPRQTTPSHSSNGHQSSPSSSPPSSPLPIKSEAPSKAAPPAEPDDYEMSFEDKQELGRKMDLLEPHQLSNVIKILGAKTQNDGDIEIDMNDVPTEKLRVLEKYVNECLQQNNQDSKPNKRRKDDDEDVVIDDQEPDETYTERKEHKKHKHKKPKHRNPDDYE